MISASSSSKNSGIFRLAVSGRCCAFQSQPRSRVHSFSQRSCRVPRCEDSPYSDPHPDPQCRERFLCQPFNVHVRRRHTTSDTMVLRGKLCHIALPIGDASAKDELTVHSIIAFLVPRPGAKKQHCLASAEYNNVPLPHIQIMHPTTPHKASSRSFSAVRPSKQQDFALDQRDTERWQRLFPEARAKTRFWKSPVREVGVVLGKADTPAMLTHKERLHRIIVKQVGKDEAALNRGYVVNHPVMKLMEKNMSRVTTKELFLGSADLDALEDFCAVPAADLGESQPRVFNAHSVRQNKAPKKQLANAALLNRTMNA